ncbi:MAG: 1-acyl-sn-glycerol-3-phosphate acyltransferase [Proteobacteria bacterium]|jgi:1-acyl-sn-glycerol-3-phosphate acyltransferase|nr:lysophospholipid acyltransferase family protein [Alphaproteobacteria bacterium]NCC02553.1 1-acyl-sn-glycerol-3-phosphate acyltransferase [Pseudomonadota bacterium]
MKKVEIWVRSLIFNFVFLFWTLVPTILFIWVIFLPHDKLIRVIRFWQSSVTFFERTIIGLDYRVIGWENVPEGACIIAAKHQSAWETCKLNVLFYDPSIVLKKELMRVPVWGWYAKASGLIPVDRKGGAKALALMMKAAQRSVAQGRKIVIFPQGTRVKPGQHKPYKVGVAALYQELNVPIVPMAVNSGLFWPKNSFIKKPGVATIEFLPAIPAGLSRSAVMRRLEDALETASNRLATEKTETNNQ